MLHGQEEAIREVIKKAYIEGIHGNQDETTVKSGFHEDFAMLVLQDTCSRRSTSMDGCAGSRL